MLLLLQRCRSCAQWPAIATGDRSGTPPSPAANELLDESLSAVIVVSLDTGYSNVARVQPVDGRGTAAGPRAAAARKLH